MGLQAASAGAFLAGTPWGTTHRSIGWVLIGAAVAQVLVAAVATSRRPGVRPLLVSSVALLFAEGLQTGTGYFRVFVVHLPLGTVIFGGLVWQLVSIGGRHVSSGRAVVDRSARPAAVVDTPAQPALRRWTIVGAGLVLVQIGLGIGHRLGIWDAVPHIAGALAPSVVLLTVCTLILERPASPPRLRRAAHATNAIVLIQVMAGIALYFMTLMSGSGSAAWLALSAVHSAAGAITLAASVALVIHTRAE